MSDVTSSESAGAFRPVFTFFPHKSRRWAAEQCRSRRLAGAIRVGREWVIRECDVNAFVSGSSASVPTEADALADLRARGIL